MKNILLTTIISFTLIFSGIGTIIAQEDAVSILKNMDAVLQAPKDKQGDVSIILVDKNGNEKVREAMMLQKGSDMRMYRYTQPESQAGIATLSLPDGVMWLYMPAFGKPKKISLLAKSQKFTGTDFSYEDIDPSPYSDRFAPTIIEIGPKSYILELTPSDNKSSYSKIIADIDKQDFYPRKLQYVDKKGDKVKVANYKYEKIGKYWNAAEVIMTDLQKIHSTKILLKNIKFDQGLTDDDFTVDKMQEGAEK